MTPVNCYSCSSDTPMFYAEENGFTLVKCRSCGLLYVSPRPEEKDILEAQKYGVHKGDYTIHTTGRLLRYRIPEYVKILRDLYGPHWNLGSGTWLDVGCGNGEFMLALKEYTKEGIHVVGIEPNIKKQERAQSLGLKVSFFDLNLSEEQFDWISMLNVFSHLPNPPEFFLILRRHLRPGGELLIETGDAACFSPDQIFKPLNLPDHLSFASESILRNLLSNAGFRVLEVRKYPAFPTNLRSIIKDLAKILLWRTTTTAVVRKYLMSKKIPTDMYIRAKMLP